ITTDGDVKLVDFGIARAAGEADVTETNTVVGTLAYTSPEHLNKTDPSPATDIYSLGIVAYQCLAGQTPFRSDKPQAVMLGHLNDPPPELPSRVPEAIARTIMTALRKEPGDRWSSAAVFAEKCRENIDSETTETRPMSATETAGADGSAVTPQATPIANDAERYRDATIPPEGAELTPQPIAPPRDSVEAESLTPQPPGRHSRRTIMVRVAAVTVTALLVGALAVWWALAPDDGTVPADEAGQAETSATKSQKSSEPVEESSSSASSDKTSEDPGSPTKDDDGNDGTAGEEDGCGDTCGTVPDVRNKSCDEAVGLLAEKGFSKTQKEYGSDPSGDVQYGAVYTQSPKAKSVVPKSSTITLYFKSG
ncbi:MAG: protein kinase domain-containing protein, partial [Stackebrandtia sp.]